MICVRYPVLNAISALLFFRMAVFPDALYGESNTRDPAEVRDQPSGPSGPAVSVETHTGLAYKWSLGRDFSQDRLLARFVEAGVCLCISAAPLPVTLGYLLRLPVANAGTRDFGLKRAIRYSHSLSLQIPVPGPVTGFTPWLQLSYIFHGYTEMNAVAELRGSTLSGDMITTPESEIDVSFTTRGYSFGAGVRWQSENQWTFYAAWIRSMEKANLRRLDINGIDQKYLGNNTIHGSVENSNALLGGVIWSLYKE